MRAAAAAALLFSLLAFRPVGAGHIPGEYFDLGALPTPGIAGSEILAGQEDFVSGHPLRVVGSPTEILAGQYLRDDAASLGYEATITTVPINTPSALSPFAALHVVTAVKRGATLPNEWILFSAHYDTIPTTIYGAYDNGSGANLLRYLARAIANVPTNRSVAFIWYSAEEEGALASFFDAGRWKKSGEKVAALLGFDMEGIAWPVAHETAETCLCMWHGGGDENLRPLLEYVNFAFLGFPNAPGKVVVRGVNERNSDEYSFDSLGFQTLRWAGMLKAASYPAYHTPDDTFPTIFEVAGGRSYYEAGLENTLKSAYYTALGLDNHLPEPAFTSSVSGSTVSFDGTSSSDIDGAISTYSWDFGDGDAGSGATPSHTYSAPGSYTVTLTVADNLWPAVERFTTAVVIVI